MDSRCNESWEQKQQLLGTMGECTPWGAESVVISHCLWALMNLSILSHIKRLAPLARDILNTRSQHVGLEMAAAPKNSEKKSGGGLHLCFIRALT